MNFHERVQTNSKFGEGGGMAGERRMRWWVCGLLGGLAMLAVTAIKAVAALPRLVSEPATGAELVGLPAAVFGMGFVGGALAGLLRPLSDRFGWPGEVVIGVVVLDVFFLCCMSCYDRPMLLGEAPGRGPMLLLGAALGAVAGPWVAADLRRG
jgi:hypothetical protein